MQAEAAATAPFLTHVDPAIAPPRRRVSSLTVVDSVLPFDPVLDCGPVMFKVAKRVSLKELAAVARPLYRLFVRSLPRWWPSRPDDLKVPPAPKAELGGFTEDKWCEAVLACRTPDHQINVLPANRTWPDDIITYRERSCRPLDLEERNQRIFLAMHRRYSGCQVPSRPLALGERDLSPCPVGFSPAAMAVLDAIERNQQTLASIDNRLKALERDIATTLDDDDMYGEREKGVTGGG